MRRYAVLVVPTLALTLVGCPQFLSDFEVASDGGADDREGGDSTSNDGSGRVDAAPSDGFSVDGPTDDVSANADTATGGDSANVADAGPDTSTDASDADACTPVTHDNGLGGQFVNCLPLNTYDLPSALAACQATFVSGCMANNPMASCQGVGAVSANTNLWIYSAQPGAGVRAGYVLNTSMGFTCPNWPSPVGLWH